MTTNEEFVALYVGDLQPDRPALVRIHSQCLTGEAFGSMRCDCGAQLKAAMRLIQREGCGAIVYQFQEARGVGILNKIRAYALQDEGADTVEANQYLGLPVDKRVFGQCAHVLLALNLRRVRVISNNPQKLDAMRGAGMEIVERIPLSLRVPASALRYMRTKEKKLGHLSAGLEQQSESDVHELILDRRSACSFSDKQVDTLRIRALLEAARRAPSSFNEQPWSFILAIQSSHPEVHAKMLSCLSPHNRKWAQHAPVLLLSAARMHFRLTGEPNRHALHDVGLAMGNLELQAAALDLSVHQMGGFDAARASSCFCIPGGWEPVTISAIGFGFSNTEEPSSRRMLEESVFQGIWGQSAGI
jgi:GTP cyclohydrolase II